MGEMDDAIDAVVESLLADALALNPTCCGTPEWRGHLCPYHEGFEDGADRALRATWVHDD